ncbi:hypothetical protein C0214_07805 [Methylobacterium sp. DM1]|nr:hypothetical protein C0214_07805 [Methylobacterium sp. DM1]
MDYSQLARYGASDFNFVEGKMTPDVPDTFQPADLPCLGHIENWDFDYITRFGGLRGQKVLCLGYSEADIDRLVAPLEPSDIQILTLWKNHIDAVAGKYKVTLGDITKRTPFQDGEFDAVLSLSLLEHVAPLEDAFLEMRRITRRGGSNFHMFGPAWSSAYGSHLYLSGSDGLTSFSKWEMPAFLHLLCSPRQIRNFYIAKGYETATADQVLEDMFSSPHINRVFYDEYYRLMSKHFRVVNAELMTNDVPDNLLSALRKKFPWATDFSTYGGKYQLIR